MTQRTVLLLAAGASRRMAGRDKLLEVVDGIPLITRQAKAAIAVADKVLVTIAPDRPDRLKALEPIQDQLVVVPVPDASSGMSASFRAASKSELSGPVMVLPCDMPELTIEHLRKVWQAYEINKERIVRGATMEGSPGHPVIFPPDLIPEFAKLTGDEGARSILKKNQPRIVKTPLPGEAAITDLDTPEAWDRWRASNGL